MVGSGAAVAIMVGSGAAVAHHGGVAVCPSLYVNNAATSSPRLFTIVINFKPVECQQPAQVTQSHLHKSQSHSHAVTQSHSHTVMQSRSPRLDSHIIKVNDSVDSDGAHSSSGQHVQTCREKYEGVSVWALELSLLRCEGALEMCECALPR